MNEERGEHQPTGQPLPYDYAAVMSYLPELEEFRGSHFDADLGTGVVSLGEAALMNDDHDAYRKWGDYMKALTEGDTGIIFQDAKFFLADFYLCGMLQGDPYAIEHFGESLAALPKVQALQLYAEHNLDPHVWISETSLSADDRAKAWVSYYDTRLSGAREKGENPDAVPLLRVTSDPAIKRRVLGAFHDAMTSVLQAHGDDARELDYPTKDSIFAFGEVLLADEDFELEIKENFVTNVYSIVRELVQTEPMIAQDYGQLLVGFLQACGEPITRIIEEIDTVADMSLYDSSVNRDVFIRDAARGYLRRGDPERAASLLPYIQATSRWLEAGTAFAWHGVDLEYLRPSGPVTIVDPLRPHLFEVMKALTSENENAQLAAHAILIAVDDRPPEVRPETEITPEIGNFLRQSLAAIIELDKPLGWEVCRTIIGRLDAAGGTWLASELCSLLAATGAERSIRDWLEYTKPESFSYRTSYFMAYAEIVNASNR